MSITSDVRSYADAALEQGRHVVDQAQGRAHGLAGKASATYTDLRGRVVALPGVEAVSSTVEPYVAQLHGYRVALTGKVEELYSGLKSNEQVAKALAPAELFVGVVLDTVDERVVKPVRSFIEPAAEKPAAESAAEPAAAKPAPAKRAAPRRTTTAKA